MTLTVLNVAYALATVGPTAVGGAEQVLARIDRALVQHGARSVVVACGGSRVCGELEATPAPAPVLDQRACTAAYRAHSDAIARVLDRCDVDVVHLHGLDFMEYLPAADVPVLATLHLPPSWYSHAAFKSARAATWLTCVSRAQRRACVLSQNVLATVENGVDIPVDPPLLARGRHAAALGRICPEKGFHLALDAAREAGVPLILGGQVFPYPAHQQYFASEILPRLTEPHQFVGPLGPDQKTLILGSARCVLVPSLVPETSSLVAMEALAWGTPVIAFDSGALPDIVRDGRTGFIVRDVREMADAIEAAGDLDPAECRQDAIERFSAERMTREYLELYERVARGDLAMNAGQERVA